MTKEEERYWDSICEEYERMAENKVYAREDYIDHAIESGNYSLIPRACRW